jgi:polyhydroxybutyrate depolymerase
MGGFMTNRLGCQLSHRIAAIASVAGTIGGAVTCNPGRTVPACHFHGTLDSTVYYEGNLYGNDAEELVAFWANNNGCNASPTITTLPDLAADDLIVTHWEYNTCDNDATVEFFKVDSAEHVWLTPANDIFYTTEIWKFFMKHTHSEFVGIENNQSGNVAVLVYPNPSNGEVFISLSEKSSVASIKVFDATGKQLLAHSNITSNSKIDLSQYETGIYFIQVNTGNESVTKKVMLE